MGFEKYITLLLLTIFLSKGDETPPKEMEPEDYSRYNIAPPPETPPPEILIDNIQKQEMNEGCGTIFTNQTLYRCLVENGQFVSIYPIIVESAQWIFNTDAYINKFSKIKGWQNISEMCVQNQSRKVEAWSWKTDENNQTDWVKVSCLVPSTYQLRYTYSPPMCFNCYDDMETPTDQEPQQEDPNQEPDKNSDDANE